MKHRRPAFSLLELLVVMGGLVALMAFGAVLLGSALRIWHAAAASQLQAEYRSGLAERFRADVRQAVALPERANGLDAGPACVILRRGDGSHVVYRWHGGRLERRTPPGEQVAYFPLNLEGASVEFRRADRIVTLHLRQELPKQDARRAWDISAALGGDLQ